jgi:hypothetical protein
MAEFWIHMYSKSCQRATSIAHTTGKPIIAAESFTSRPPDGRWQDTPGSLKPIGDMAFALGINPLLLPLVRPSAAQRHRAGLHALALRHALRPHNTWWPQAHDFVWYIARCQSMLQRGKDVRDVLMFRHDDLEHSDFADYPDVPAGYKWDPRRVEATAHRHGRGREDQAPIWRVVRLADPSTALVGERGSAETARQAHRPRCFRHRARSGCNGGT